MGQAPEGATYNSEGLGLPLLAGAGDLGELEPEPTRFTSEPTRIARPGDIILCVRATLGKTNWARREHCLGRGVAALRAKPSSLDPGYLWHWIATQGLALEGKARGSTFRQVTRSAVESLRIPVPPLPEQRRIAAILDKADAVRRKRQKTLDLADEFLRSAFLDMFGDPVTNPKGWPERRLDSFAEIRGGVTKGRKLNGHHVVTVPYVRVANVQDGFLDLREVKQIEVLDADVDKYRLLSGDVLLTEGGDPDKLGRGAVWTGEIDPCIHQNHIFSVRVDAHVAEPQYISTLIGSAYGKRYFLRAGKQTTGVATINKTQLCGFPAFLPPVRLQHAYASLVGHVGQLQRHRMLSLNAHDALARSLVMRAFRGEI
jgi:type I restriction enzyme S subunit